MTIIYAPDGTPYDIPYAEVPSFIQKGYRTSKPETPQPDILPTIDTTKTGGVGILKEESNSDGPPQRQATDVVPSLGQADGSWDNNYQGKPIPVNKASLKELTSLPGIGTAIARKVIDNRPYTSAEDLIAKVPIQTGSWLAIADKLTFD